jgi:excisionase family DNA binding protein
MNKQIENEDVQLNRRLAMSVDEAAHQIGKGRNYMYQQIALGRLKSFKLGNSRRIAYVDLIAFINAAREEAGDR